MAIDRLSRPPSLCETHTQLQTALGDLQDDFKLIRDITDFIQEELGRADRNDWRVARPYILALALDHRVERFRLNLNAVAELSQGVTR
jgi:hypothetical protein